MNELNTISSIIVLLILITICVPFFRGQGGALLDASKDDSIEKLRAKQNSILERWLKDEAAAKEGLFTAREWKMREVYLTNRYVDTTRRLNWLEASGVSS